MYQNVRRHEIIFTVAAVALDETKSLLNLKKGDRLLAIHAEKQILAAAATDTTITVGDATDTDGLITAIDTESGAVGDLVNGTGAYMIAGGKLYTADTVMTATYDNGTTPGAVAPRIKITALIAHATGM